LVYQANPIALLIQQAGGLATDGVNPILPQVPLSLHQSTPLVFGSSTEVNQVLRYHDGIDHAGIHSPLFSSRGLFRK
jgi:fructose-1,6-bisphosphatase I